MNSDTAIYRVISRVNAAPTRVGRSGESNKGTGDESEHAHAGQDSEPIKEMSHAPEPSSSSKAKILLVAA